MRGRRCWGRRLGDGFFKLRADPYLFTPPCIKENCGAGGRAMGAGLLEGPEARRGKPLWPAHQPMWPAGLLQPGVRAHRATGAAWNSCRQSGKTQVSWFSTWRTRTGYMACPAFLPLAAHSSCAEPASALTSPPASDSKRCLSLSSLFCWWRMRAACCARCSVMAAWPGCTSAACKRGVLSSTTKRPVAGSLQHNTTVYGQKGEQKCISHGQCSCSCNQPGQTPCKPPHAFP